ncbi:MAG TPA: FlgD immunoglobulin-like domain containing protein, partial [Bacteroidota bacterium]|nr:FlgD immunoglobulin-like domain containing protein [Bacteroidota bacterium]
TIRYQLPEDGTHIRVLIYNTLGELVRTLVDATQAAGSYDVTWDARSDAGSQASSGIYFYRITATGTKEFTSVKKMLLLK